MDNHADNLIVNNNYIAGLVDSDFGVYIDKFYPRNKVQLKPMINFVNTRFNLIELVSDYLNRNCINHHISFRKATIGKDKKEILISRQDKCIEFINNIYSSCVIRKKQLEILRCFCEDRLYCVKELGWKQNNTPYTDYQHKLYEDLYLLNLNYNFDFGDRNYTESWLAGFLDGDGSICFVVSNDRIIPTIDFTTGSDAGLNNIKDIFEINGIKYNVRTSLSKSSKLLGKNKKKYCYNVYVRSHESLRILLGLLNNKSTAKQNQISLMYNYLNTKKHNKNNTSEIWDIVNEVKILNNNYQNISETNTQNTLKSEDRVQLI